MSHEWPQLNFVTGDQGINSMHSNHLVTRILQDYAVEVIKMRKGWSDNGFNMAVRDAQKPREMVWESSLDCRLCVGCTSWKLSCRKIPAPHKEKLTYGPHHNTSLMRVKRSQRSNGRDAATNGK